ncbi:sirohydrochlorin chelatase [Kitasatospora sp. NPDC056783]|uniref:sirohydrochlorin chelatase n=1 Tax=Kitasatospora sp. NPDC056783 TaxID=3345943 RepID=UPI003677A0A1
MPALLLIAHGSRDPRHAATVAALVEEVRARRPGTEVATAYLDHCAPRIPQVVGRLGDAVAVPLLLNRAFHAKHDIPAALRAAGSRLPVADVLGPSPLLLAALDRRLAEAGLDLSSPAVRARTGVVLAAAGSSAPAPPPPPPAGGGATRGPPPGGPGAGGDASAAGPRVPDALAALRSAGAAHTAVAPYLLAPGLLPDRITAAAEGADTIADVLGPAPEVAALLLRRHDEAAHAARTTRALTA